MKPRFQLAFRFFVAITMVQSSTAATGTWSGAFNGTWDTSDLNWSGVTNTPWDVTNGPGNIALFNTASLAAVVNGPVFTNGITFSTTGDLSGSTINLVGTTPGISVATGQTGSISSIIAGSAGLIKSGDGLLTLSGVNTYTGGTTVSAGRLRLVNNKTGSSDFVTNAELEFNVTSGSQQLNGGTISGIGNLIKTGGGTLMLGASGSAQAVALTGATSIIDVQGGVLRNEFGNSAWGGNKAGLNVASGAYFDLWDGNATVDELTGSGIINKGWFESRTLTIGVNDGSGTFSGTIVNSTNFGYGGNPGGFLSLVKQGTGTQILSGINTYAGSTIIAAGTLQLSGAGALSSSTAVSVAGGATFDVGGRNLTIAGLSGAGAVINASGVLTVNKANGSGIFSGVLSGGTGLTKTGAGGLSLAGANTYSGDTIVSAGILGVRKNTNTSITVDSAGGLALAVGAGATYYTTADVDSLWAGSLSGVSIHSDSLVGIDTTAGDLSYTTPNSNLSRGFAKLGNNTLTLTGTNAYTGGTSVLGGVLSFSSTSAMPSSGTVTAGPGAGVALAVGGTGYFTTADVDSLWANTLSGFSLDAASSVGIDTTQGDLSYTTPGSNLGRGFVKVGTGTLTLSGATYTGGTTVGAGKLILVNTKTDSANFVTNGDLDFNLTSGGQTLNGGSITGTGNLIKSGGSTLQLGANNSPQKIALTGASSIIDVQGGILKNDWGNIAWTDNKAGLTVASGAIFDIWDGNAAVDELSGSGTIRKNSGGSLGTLTFGVNDGSGTFSGTISHSAGTMALVKQGSGTQTLSGTITYTGGTTVNGGRLKFVDTKTGSSNFITHAELEFNVTSGTQTLSGGTISGTGNLIKTGAGTFQFGAFGPTAQAVALTGETSIIDVQEGILKNDYFNSAWGDNRAGLTVASDAIFDIWDGNATVDELNGSGTIRKGQGGTGTLTIGVNDGSGIFAGTITNPQGAMSLVKQGTGTQTLSSTNTYTGTTTVSQGSLIVGDGVSGSLANTSVTVGGNGSSGTPTLGGRGMIAGATTISSAGTGVVGTHAPGFAGVDGGVGTQTFNRVLSYQAGSIFEWDLKTGTVGVAGTDFDAVALTTATGSLSVDDNATTGAIFRIVLGESFNGANAFWSDPAMRSWNVFTATSGATLGSSVFTRFQLFDTSSATVPVDFSAYGSFGFTNNGSTGSLTWTAVPEPTSALAGLLLATGLLRRRRG